MNYGTPKNKLKIMFYVFLEMIIYLLILVWAKRDGGKG